MRRFLRLGTGHDSTLWPVLLLTVDRARAVGGRRVDDARRDGERAPRRAAAARRRVSRAARNRQATASTSSGRQQLDAARRHRRRAAAGAGVCRMRAQRRRRQRRDSRRPMDAWPTLRRAPSIAAPTERSDRGLEIVPSGWSSLRTIRPKRAEAYQAIAAEADTMRSSPPAPSRRKPAALLRAGDRDGAIAVLQQLAQGRCGHRFAAAARWPPMPSCDCSNSWTRDSAGMARSRRESRRSAQQLRRATPAADQRRFLMHALVSLDPTIDLKTLEAEDLAAEFVDDPLRAGSARRAAADGDCRTCCNCVRRPGA